MRHERRSVPRFTGEFAIPAACAAIAPFFAATALAAVIREIITSSAATVRELLTGTFFSLLFLVFDGYNQIVNGKQPRNRAGGFI